MSKIYKVWLERVEADEIERGKIRQFCVGIVPISMGYGERDRERPDRYRFCGHKTTLNMYECTDIIDAFDARVERDGGPKVSEEQAKFGRNWLTRYAPIHHLPRLDYSTIECFRFANALVVDENGYRATVVPEYDCYFPDGSVLRYSVASWMSGIGKHIEWRWIKRPERNAA